MILSNGYKYKVIIPSGYTKNLNNLELYNTIGKQFSIKNPSN